MLHGLIDVLLLAVLLYEGRPDVLFSLMGTFFKVDMQALGQQVTDKKQQEDYERKRELAFGMIITFTLMLIKKHLQFCSHINCICTISFFSTS